MRGQKSWRSNITSRLSLHRSFLLGGPPNGFWEIGTGVLLWGCRALDHGRNVESGIDLKRFAATQAPADQGAPPFGPNGWQRGFGLQGASNYPMQVHMPLIFSHSGTVRPAVGSRHLRWAWLLVVFAAGCTSQPPVSETGAGPVAVHVARSMVGKPYRFGGASPRGFDCSGLVHYSFGEAGHAVPRETGALFSRARRVAVSDLRPGDLLFFRIDGKPSHVAIYVDEDRFVHAPSSGKQVSYGTLSNPYWKKRLVKAGRL